MQEAVRESREQLPFSGISVQREEEGADSIRFWRDQRQEGHSARRSRRQHPPIAHGVDETLSEKGDRIRPLYKGR
ncbi:hypothetical protein ACLOJK_040847 [Asimina triloba]